MEKSLSNLKLEILYQTKKKKEEEKNTFMSIVDLPIILLINALLEIKIKLPQAVPISLITNQNYSKKKNLRSIRCKISNIEFTLTVSNCKDLIKSLIINYIIIN